MSRPSYVRTTKPVPALDLSDVKAHCRADGSFEDVFLSGLIDAATAYVQDYQWSQLMSATWELRMDRFPCDGVIPLHPNPVSSVTSVAYNDYAGTATTLTVNTHYTVDVYSKPARIIPAFATSWPSTRGHINDVVVTFVAGHATSHTSLPDGIRQAMLLLVGHWYRHRESAASGSQAADKSIAFATKALLDMNSYRVFF